MCIPFLPMRATCSVNLSFLELIILIILGESASYETPHYAVFSILLSLHVSSVQIFSSALCSHQSRLSITPRQNILSLRSSLNVRDQVSHPYTTTDNIINFCVLIFTFLDSTREYKRFWTEWQQALLELPLLLISSQIIVRFVNIILTL
jgi:hypothetical protein